MSYEVLRYIFIIFTVLSGIMLIVSVMLFIFFKIPRVIGDLTGATARKAIKNIRDQNESSGEKIYKSSAVNAERGRLTDKISATGNILHHERNPLGGAMATAKISAHGMTQSGERSVITNCTNETTVLGNETTVLMSSSNETTVLNQQNKQEEAFTDSQLRSKIFEIEYEITFIHTNEVIS